MEKEYIERKARYIDAYSLSDKVFKSKKNNPHLIDVVARNHNCEHEHFLRLIADESTADVVEVVRCKDCQYYEPKNSLGTQGICMCGEKEMNYAGEFYPYETDFCSYGERKEGAEE